ncbi:MAG: DUF6282 family protein, partial [Candidatus Staskawiczbacteria bacterium]|nr:DUF6282 family protein [Candidatus Staskawiczbacteria bacterium]
GMKAVILKNHNDSTVLRAFYVQKIVRDINVFGGIVLNDYCGGINPVAVKNALELGAKIIWFPTTSAKNHRRYFKQHGGITIIKKGVLNKETIEVLRLIKQYDAILATGHLSFAEIKCLIKEAKSLKIKNIIVSHPESKIINLSLSEQKDIALGGVFFERCYFPVTDPKQLLPINKIIEGIKLLGCDSTILATDLGQSFNLSPIDGFKEYLSKLIEGGVSQEEIKVMINKNPKRCLAL